MTLVLIAFGAALQGSWWIAGICGVGGVLQIVFQALVAE